MKVTTDIPTKVISSSLFLGLNNKLVVECHMDNGSIWHTDSEGKEWKQIKKTESELTHLFDAWKGGFGA